MRAYCLSFHAGYRCARSGACCTTGWPVPVDERLVPVLRGRGLLPATGACMERVQHPVYGSTLLAPRMPGGACGFYEADRDGLCAIHRVAGEAALPVACRNFPRVTLRDRRGLFLTLSHYCPAAARLLLRGGDITIVEAPLHLSLGGEAEGLDARAVMPPLLRTGMLMDLVGYGTWEREALDVLNDRRYPAAGAVDIIRAATDDAAGWCPGPESLAQRLISAFARARVAHTETARGTLPPLEHARKKFVAAHLFASWAAYQKGGVLAVCDAIEAALGLLDPAITDEASFVAAVRAADLRLRHLTHGDTVNLLPAPGPHQVGRPG